MDCSTPGLPVHHEPLEFTQTHVHRVGDAIQPSHSLLSPTPPTSIFPSIRVFSNESVLHIRWPKDWSISFSISPSKWIFRIYKTRSFLIRMLILYSNGDPTIITSSKHKYLSKALSPHTISLGLRASRWVWGNTIQSFASTHYQAQLWIIEMCQWLKQIKNYAFRLLTIHEYMYVAGGQRAEIQIDVVNNLF